MQRAAPRGKVKNAGSARGLPIKAARAAALSAPAAARANQAGRPTLAELERRKQRVMEVATDLFVEHGYAATSLVDIAKRAGVATRTLYQHFGDKEAMFRDVIFARDTGAIIPPPVLQPGDTLFDALMRTARYARAVALRDRSIGLMRLMVAESRRFPDLMKKVANATYSRFQGNIAKIFEDLALRGHVPAESYAISAKMFLDLILGNVPMLVYTDWLVEAGGDTEIEIKVKLFIRGWFKAEGATKMVRVR